MGGTDLDRGLIGRCACGVEPSDVVRLAASLGLTATAAPTALTAGLGGNDLWRVKTAAGDVVLRIFPAGPTGPADREAAAHRFAGRHGLLVPPVLAAGSTGDRPVLALGWVGGESVGTVLRRADTAAADLGRSCGATLARLHAIGEQPPDLVGERPWIAWGGELPADLEARLGRFTGGRLLHLDFHPENLILTPGGGPAVLDWANVRIGPPQADLARTVSILELVRDAVPGLDDRSRVAVDVFTAELIAGYAAAGGDAEMPPPIRAWAYAVQIRDLAGSWVPGWYFERLRRRCVQLAAG